ncbi:MAG TPA: PD-(D/E)XK nuclease family protein [Thermoanaerobaculia bacterium]
MTIESRVIVAAGARAVERRLLSEIEAALPLGEVASPALLVVVPSHSLREHLLGRLAARRRAWLGVEISTLAGVAASILARTGGVPPSGAALVPLLVARLAASERALASALGGLASGYGEIEGAVSDLLDAGFDAAHVEAFDERLELERAAAGAAAIERALAIARVAAGVRGELARLGLTPESDLLAESARRLAANPAAALPAGAVFVHGFADATGIATDLLAAIVRHRATRVFLDAPPELDGGPAAWRFGSRLRERLSGVATVEIDSRPSTPAAVVALRAADPVREARAAVAWLAEASSAAPESSALVARDLGDLASWARELDRQSLPGSSAGGLLAARARRAAGLLELLERRDETPLGVALEVARERLEDDAGVPVADLRLAFARLGARQLAAAAALAPRERPIRLPLADRIGRGDAGDVVALPRRVAPRALAAAVSRLARIREGVAAMTRPAALGVRVAATELWLAETLPAAELEPFAAPLALFAAAPLAAVETDAAEWRDLAAAAWRNAAAEPLGHGGGAALLSVTEARGRTFERLALAGLSRDRFPRAVRPDPLLPDSLRLRLRDLLPDLPVKGEGHDEERFLFAQLLASADAVALLRPLADGAGRELPPSPLADEWCRRNRVEETPAERDSPAALDRAIEVALAGDRGRLAPALAAAMREAAERFDDPRASDAERLADARLALLAERDPAPSQPASRRLGAFFGAVGEIGADDPRSRPPSVTALERLAGCGWRAFLERVLRLAPLPELGEALPALPGRLIGNVVHDVLESLLPKSGAPLEAALAQAQAVAEWPAPADLERRARAAARRVLLHEMLDPELFEAPLAREAMARLAVAGAADWRAGRRALLAVEAAGEAPVAGAGGGRRVPFRVDRVERVDGEVWLTDYKTGRPLSSAVTAAARRRHLARGIARGESLQLAIYLLGVGNEPARARYLQLDPHLDERARELALTRSELAGMALAPVLDALFAAWDAGAFVPRLLEPDRRTIYPACATCDVREACVQGDSGARLRLATWLETEPESDRGFERPARAWWALRGGGAAEEEA